ncbi:MAG: hypothetical protein LBV28_05455, partial [Puniceicoccales bacterium]|nr:hypothetical protein [Puniceicoccales bacterium]
MKKTASPMLRRSMLAQADLNATAKVARTNPPSPVRARRTLSHFLAAAATLAAAGFGTAPVSDAATIDDFLVERILSISFGGTAVSYGEPGAIPVDAAYWYTAGGNTNTGGASLGTDAEKANRTGVNDLLDSTGTLHAEVTLKWASANSYGIGVNASAGSIQGQILRRYLDDGNHGAHIFTGTGNDGAQVQLTGLDVFFAGGAYDVYVYTSGDSGGTMRAMWVNGAYYYGVAGDTASGSNTNWASQNLNSAVNINSLTEGTGGQYIQIEGLNAGTLNIQGGSNGSSGRGPINAIQVVGQQALSAGDIFYWNATGTGVWDTTAENWNIGAADGDAGAYGIATSSRLALFDSGSTTTTTATLDGAHTAGALWVKSGDVIFNGTGSLTVSEGAKVIIDGTANASLTLTGAATLNIPATAQFTIESGASFNIADRDFTLAASVDGTGAINVSNGTLTFARSSTAPVFVNTPISGDGNIAHDGTGTTV